MKRTALINLICSLVAAVVVIVGVLLVMMLSDNAGLEKRKLVISSPSATATYDGKPLFDDKGYLAEGKLAEGHELYINVTGSQTNVGISENYVSARVLDRDGVDVTEEYYNIEYRPGILNVRARPICIIAGSAMKIYDGKPLTCDSYTLESSVSLLPTDTLEVTIEGSITEAGEIQNSITNVLILDENKKDVSQNYEIESRYGKLVVYDNETIIIYTDNDGKPSDGDPLQNSNWWTDKDSKKLMQDHVLDVQVTGSQTEYGESENTFTASVRDEHGNDVSHLYKIVSRPGKLTVFKADVTVISKPATKPYDGDPLTCEEFEVIPASFIAKGFVFVPEIVGSQTEVGKSPNTIDSCKVYDSSGADVTENFNIIPVENELLVTDTHNTPQPLVFQSKSARKTYDGTPLTCEELEIKSGSLLEGHIAVPTFTAVITDAGQVANLYTVKIIDRLGADVTDQYYPETLYGELTIDKIDVDVTAKSEQKVYDGLPLTCNEFEVSPNHLLDTYTFVCEIIGSRTAVGKTPNDLTSCHVFDSEENDISHNFNINMIDGELEVVETEEEITPELTFTSGSAEKIFDGKPLSCTEWERTEGSLPSTYTVIAENFVILDKLGKIDNEFTVRILNELSEDVTDQFKIEYKYGSLEIHPKEITVISDSAQKIYDGTPLTKDSYTVKNTNDTDTTDPIGDKILSVTVTGTITDPGSTPNTISGIVITDSEGNDVSYGYVIKKEEGTLIIFSGNEDPLPSGKVIFEVYSDVDDRIYLKQISFGNYNPATNTWSAAPEYGASLPDGRSMYYLPALALDSVYASPNSLTITPVQKIFALPYYTLSGSFTPQTGDTAAIGSVLEPYTVNYYNWDYTAGVEVPTELSGYESAYAAFTQANYCDVDTDTYNLMQRIISNKRFTKTDPDIINKVASYIQSAAKYDLNYDKALDSEENMVIAFLTEYKTGVCRHYAQAATLLFRSLGIPARYTVGFADNVSAGTVTEITDKTGHAWVEVYVNGLGWIAVEVTGSASSDNDSPQSLIVKPVDTFELYNNTTVYAKQEVIGLEHLVSEGYSYEAVISGVRTTPGITVSVIESLIIKDPTDTVVYDKNAGIGADEFIIDYSDGILHLYISHLEFVSADDSKEFDGTPLYGSKSHVTMTGGTLDADHYYDTVHNVSITDFGEIPNEFTVIIYDTQTGDDITDQYLITVTTGTLSITKPKLVYVSESDEKTYDGTPLTNGRWERTEGALPSGYKEIVNVTGSITKFTEGGVENEFTVTIYNSENVDVTSEFYIDLKAGTLMINKKEITVTTESDSKEYDGTPLTNGGYSVSNTAPDDTSSTVGDGETITVTVTGTITEPGSTENTFEVSIVNPVLGDVTECYNVTPSYGTLTVELLRFVFVSGSAVKPYDGTALTCTDVEITSGKLPKGYTVEWVTTGAITEVGTADNEFTVKIFNTESIDITSQLSVIRIPGILEVVKKQITITSASDQKMYDGEPLTNSNYTVTNTDPSDSFPALGEDITATVSVTGSRTEPGKTPNTIASVTINKNGVPVNDYYIITTKEGTLTVLSGNEAPPPTGKVIFEVYSYIDDTVYLKTQSYGNYNVSNNSWSAAPEYSATVTEGKSAYYLPALTLSESGAKTYSMSIDPVYGIFALPYYTHNGSFEVQGSDVMMSGSTTDAYFVNFFNWDNTAGIETPSKYTAFEDAYASFVKANYCDIDDQTDEYMKQIISEKGFLKTDPDIYNKVAKYIKTAAEYNLEYDLEMENEENVVIAFLDKYKSGVCRHYALAATMLFRSLDIPARYTVGFMEKVTSNTMTEITDERAHAWVEVYIDNIGWVMLEVTGSSSLGNTITNLTVAPVYTGASYNGNEIFATQAISGFDALAEEGYTYEVEISGSRTELGISESEIVSFTIKNALGTVVYDKNTGVGTDKLSVTYQTGTIQVYYSSLTFNVSQDLEKVYDGTPLVATADMVTKTYGTLADGHDYEITVYSSSITNVGRISISYSVTIYDINTGRIVNDYYRISKSTATLTVNAKPITVTAGSAERVYISGTPLVCNDITYDKNELINGDYIYSYRLEGSQTAIGESSNIIREVIIHNKNSQDVTSNYSITVIDGFLKVTAP